MPERNGTAVGRSEGEKVEVTVDSADGAMGRGESCEKEDGTDRESLMEATRHHHHHPKLPHFPLRSIARADSTH